MGYHTMVLTVVHGLVAAADGSVPVIPAGLDATEHVVGMSRSTGRGAIAVIGRMFRLWRGVRLEI